MKNVKKFISDMDVPLLVVSIILFVFGLLNIVNASSQAVVIRYGSSLYAYFYKQLVSLFLGFIGTLIILKIPTKRYYKLAPLLYIVITGLLFYLAFLENLI